jgi:LysR family transcriptional regulator, regulator for bpeEF and oprC
MDLNALAAFAAAADKLSFTDAAAALGLTASGVSKAVSRLEDGLHVRLFNRSTRSLSLTPDGAVFLERCRQILADVEDARRLMQQSQSAPAGRLRVTMPTMYGRMVIVPAIAAFLRRFPQVSVEAGITDRVVDMVEEGYDVAVRFGVPPDARVVARPLAGARFVTAASPAYLAAHPAPLHPGDLAHYNCIAYVSPTTRRVLEWSYVDGGAPFQHAPDGNLVVDNGESVVDAALAHAGLIYCHDYLVARELADGRLVQVLEEFAAPPAPVSLVTPHNRRLSPRVRAFVDFVTDYAAR